MEGNAIRRLRQLLLPGAFAGLIVLWVTACGDEGPQAIHPPGEMISVNGAKIWYESEGQGEPLVLIAGGPGDSHTYFHPHMSQLATDFRVIYFDAYGRGKSDRSADPEDYTFARDVADLEGLRQALGLDRMHLLGHSYGGVVAQAYALEHPEYLRSLILSNTFHSGEMWQANDDNCNHELRQQFPEVWEQVQALRRAGHLSSSPEHQEAYVLPRALLYYYDPTNIEKLVLEPNGFNPDVYFTIVGPDAEFVVGGDLVSIDFRERLQEIDVPTLVVAGRYDRVAIPRLSAEYQTFMPQAKFIMLEACGHSPFIEKPQQYFEAIRNFSLP